MNEIIVEQKTFKIAFNYSIDVCMKKKKREKKNHSMSVETKKKSYDIRRDTIKTYDPATITHTYEDQWTAHEARTIGAYA